MLKNYVPTRPAFWSKFAGTQQARSTPLAGASDAFGMVRSPSRFVAVLKP